MQLVIFIEKIYHFDSRVSMVFYFIQLRFVLDDG